MDIPSAIWVAIVGALASVAAASFSVYSALRAAKTRSETDVILEQYKAEDARRRRAFDVATSESAPVIEALTLVWADIQVIRDVIQKTVAPARYSTDLALETLRDAADRISDGYRRFGSLLPADAQAAWHAVRGRVGLVEELVQERLADEGTGILSREAIDERLLSIRDALREDQSVLQHTTMNVRAEEMERVLKMM